MHYSNDNHHSDDAPVDLVLSRLGEVKRTEHQQWQALCPAHDDHDPSLSIAVGDDGRVLLHCHAGCGSAEVLNALGLAEADLFPRRSPPLRSVQQGSRSGSKSEQPKKMDATYDYKDQGGKLLYQVLRYEPKAFRQRRPGEEGEWIWNLHGVERVLYRLPDLLNAEPERWFFVVEGEKDADALAAIGLTATTNSGGAGKWGQCDSSVLDDRRVAIIPDRDDTGRQHAEAIAASLNGAAADVRILDLGSGGDFTGKDVSEWLDWLDAKEPSELAEALYEMAEDASQWTSHCWATPKPLTREIVGEERFPVDALPQWLKSMVTAVSVSLQTPPALAGCLALAIISVAVAGMAQVTVKSSWSEPLNLFTMVSLPSGTRKSAVFGIMTHPVSHWEIGKSKEISSEIARAQFKRQLMERRMGKLQKEAAKGDDEAAEDAEALAVRLDNHRVPISPQLFTTDATPEAVAKLMAEQGGRAAVLSADGGGIVDILSGARYGKHGRSNFDIFLQGHAGDTVRVDRASRQHSPIRLDSPALSLALAVQPRVVEDCYRNEDFRERGFLARILLALPPNPLGTRDVDSPGIRDQVQDIYNEAVMSLLGIPRDGAPSNLVLSDEAWKLLRDFSEELEPELAPGGKYEHMSGWASKLPGQIARMAGLLHLATDPQSPTTWDTPISDTTMEDAIRLGRFFESHAVIAFGEYSGPHGIGTAKRIMSWVKREDLRSFSMRDGYRALGVRKSEFTAGLKLLEAKGWVRKIEDNTTGNNQRGRQPSPVWEVNPAIHSGPVKAVERGSRHE